MLFIVFFVGFLLGLSVCFGFFYFRRKPDFLNNTGAAEELLKERVSNLETENKSLLKSLRQIENEKISQETENRLLKEQKKDLELLHEKLQKDFENLANKIFEKKHSQFRESSEKAISLLLTPLKEKISDFQKRVELSHSEDIKHRTSLITELKHMTNVHEKMSEETKNLTHALKGDTKVQGDWGEFALRLVLERSGLRNGKEYIEQGAGLDLKGEDGVRKKPDFIISLPDDKHIIIDAKVSLTHYSRFLSSKNSEAKSKELKSFLQSLKNHIKDLSGKQYTVNKRLTQPDFVLLFFPIEGALSLAIDQDDSLFSYAWERSIAIVSPSTLFATLRTVASLWKMEQQNRNAKEIADEGARLYEKFIGFLQDFQNIEVNLDKAKNSYHEALRKMRDGRGNLISRAEKLKALGITSQKEVPPSLSEGR